MSNRYLETFFKEKDLPFETWEMTDDDGVIHILSNEVVIETILHGCNSEEQAKIAQVIRRIDFRNGNVNDFLKHLAQGLINNKAA